MSLYRELAYNKEIDSITGVQFCVLSPDEIRSRSVVEITNNKTYNANDPPFKGLFDRRMGVIDHDKLCVTCEQKNTFCPGHFGHIELARPVFHVHFIEIVKKLLQSICFRCSRLKVLLDQPEIAAVQSKRITRQKRWEIMAKLCSKATKCPHCGFRQPDHYRKDSALRMLVEWRNEEAKRQILNAEDVLRILRRTTDADVDALGFCATSNRPEWLICTVLLVPPPAVRPTVKNDTGQRQEDDLTHKLMNIVKANNTLKDKLASGAAADSGTVDISYQLLQLEIANLIDNNMPGVPQSRVLRTNRPIRSLTDRLKSKEGRIRGNLMGKRVDFSARSVITPDPNISIDELGVPIKIAMNLTIPEALNQFSMERLTKLVLAGPDQYPGAKFVHKARENRKVRLRGIDRAEFAANLEYGDIVERHLQDNDYVLFNRQPSLHKMSMMGHRVRVMPFNTFRLNVCVTPNFNADFDGDEMNMHVPQSMQTHEELRQLAAVLNQIISPRECKPIISIVQDIALGVYRMTFKDQTVSARQFMNLVCSNRGFTSAFRPGAEVSCRDLLSTVIPRGVHVSVVDADDAKKNLSIVDGTLLHGTVTKETYQGKSIGLVHSIHNDFGKETARQFFDNTQKLVCDWLVLNGFSVGISDLIVTEATRAKFEDVIAKMQSHVAKIIRSVHEGTFENATTKKNNETFELNVNRILNEASSQIGNMALKQILDTDNRLINMIKAKSKGSDINVSQMVGCVGQQNVDGKRIPFGFDSRTLPHFSRFDDSPESRGFVKNSFVSGLSPQEFFFHSMGGREGLIDTAVKTSETGYIQRKLVKAMEDFKINHDGTVRNAGGNIIQFIYGEDGMDPIKIEKQSLPTVKLAPHAIVETYTFAADLSDLKAALKPKAFATVSEQWTETAAAMDQHAEQLIWDREFVIVKMSNNTVPEIEFPVHLGRLLMRYGYDGKEGRRSDLTPLEVLAAVDRLIGGLRINYANKVPIIFAILLRCYLSPTQVLLRHRFERTTFETILKDIRRRFIDSIADASEMVGVVAAQSISEPTTQLTLNSFHLSGWAAASSAVRGVPRLKELIDCTPSKNLKTPEMSIFFHENISSNKELCTEVMGRVRLIRIVDIINKSDIYFDPAETAGLPSVIPKDSLFIELYDEFRKTTCPQEIPFSPWVLRMEFDRKKMLILNVTMADVDNALQDFYEDRISCVFSDDNAAELVFRVRLSVETTNGSDLFTELRALEHHMHETVAIRGVRDIMRVSLQDSMNNKVYNQSTHLFDIKKELYIITDGSNLADIMGVEGIDSYRTTTNDIYEIFNVLGVEAARKKLYDEIVDVLASTYVNYRHVALLVDAITNKGNLMSVNRHGINQGDNGPLAKCSFEETIDRIVKAGVFSEKDNVDGVSANIMLGQVAPCGTGYSQILVDADKLPDAPSSMPYVIGGPEAPSSEEDLKAAVSDKFTFSIDL
jgi:DNA-directed RNA polymerase II subunit RPB1